MRKLLCGLGGGFLLYSLLISSFIIGAFGDPEEACVPRNSSYNVADTKQCDLYHECVKTGKLIERLCDDGFVYSKEIHACDYPHNVNCSERPLLQPSQSKVKECERLNGLYAFPPDISCQKFYHCLEGKAYEKTCPEGVIFDPSKGACIHPDLSHRKDCAARAVLNFTCPNQGKKFARLRFGDHDRLAHPTNCRKFFICLADGKPRVGGCPLGKVFNPKLGMCDSPKRVPQCKDYYGKKDLAKLAQLAELGEEGSLLLEEDENGEQIESTTEEEVHHVPEQESPKKGPTKKKTFSKRQSSPFDAANSASPDPSQSSSQQPQQQGPGPADSAQSPTSQNQGSTTDDEDDDADATKSDNDSDD